MTEDKKAKLEKCAVLKAKGGRCIINRNIYVTCKSNTPTECPCLDICNKYACYSESVINPSTELIAARLAAVAEYEAKCAEQPHKLTTPTRDQLLTWVCSSDALGWVVNVFIDFLDAWEIYPVQSNIYLDAVECNQFSRTSPTGEYIWHRPMWDSVAGKIVMVPVEG